jgi:WD40 repeat protein
MRFDLNPNGKRKPRLAALLVAVLASSSSAEEAKEKVTYDDHVAPVLRESCFTCHNLDKDRGGLVLTSYLDLMDGGSSGEVIQPGDPDSSRLFLLVSHREEPRMPPSSDRLPEAKLEVIRKWIAGGALENAGSKAKVRSAPKLDLVVAGTPGLEPDGPPPMPEGVSLATVVKTEKPGAALAAAASPWAPLLALGGQRQVLLYHSETLELLGVLPFEEGIPHSVRFSRNGTLLVVGGGRGGSAGRVALYQVRSGERIAEIGDELDVVLAADLLADQSQVALGGPGRVVRVYSTADGSLLGEVRKHTDWILALEYSPDGVLLATADRAGGLWIWEAIGTREYLNLPGHKEAILSMSWRPDSNVLATASEDGSVQLWEMENGNMIKRWGAHSGGVTGVSFLSDGRLVTCGRDRVVKLWGANGNLERQFPAFGDIATVAVGAHDGSRIVGGDYLGDLRVWDSKSGEVLGSLALNPPTLEERIELATQELQRRVEEEEKLASATEAARSALGEAERRLDEARKAFEEAENALEQGSSAVQDTRTRLERLNAMKR